MTGSFEMKDAEFIQFRERVKATLESQKQVDEKLINDLAVALNPANLRTWVTDVLSKYPKWSNASQAFQQGFATQKGLAEASSPLKKLPFLGLMANEAQISAKAIKDLKVENNQDEIIDTVFLISMLKARKIIANEKWAGLAQDQKEGFLGNSAGTLPLFANQIDESVNHLVNRTPFLRSHFPLAIVETPYITENLAAMPAVSATSTLQRQHYFLTEYVPAEILKIRENYNLTNPDERYQALMADRKKINELRQTYNEIESKVNPPGKENDDNHYSNLMNKIIRKELPPTDKKEIKQQRHETIYAAMSAIDDSVLSISNKTLQEQLYEALKEANEIKIVLESKKERGQIRYSPEVAAKFLDPRLKEAWLVSDNASFAKGLVMQGVNTLKKNIPLKKTYADVIKNLEAQLEERNKLSIELRIKMHAQLLYCPPFNTLFPEKELNQLNEQIYFARLDQAFESTFYVNNGWDGDKPGKKRSWRNYFLGVPDFHYDMPPSDPTATYLRRLDLASYWVGGFIVIPIKNTVKLLTECLFKFIAEKFANGRDRLNEKTSILAKIGYGLCVAGNSFFTGLWVLTRMFTSPITATKAAGKFGLELGKRLGGTPLLGNILAGVFAATSGLISLAGYVVLCILLPPLIVKGLISIPGIGPGLTSFFGAIGTLPGVSTMAAGNFSLTTALAPTIATEVGSAIAGLCFFRQMSEMVIRIAGKAGLGRAIDKADKLLFIPKTTIPDEKMSTLKIGSQLKDNKPLISAAPKVKLAAQPVAHAPHLDVDEPFLAPIPEVYGYEEDKEEQSKNDEPPVVGEKERQLWEELATELDDEDFFDLEEKKDQRAHKP